MEDRMESAAMRAECRWHRCKDGDMPEDHGELMTRGGSGFGETVPVAVCYRMGRDPRPRYTATQRYKWTDAWKWQWSMLAEGGCEAVAWMAIPPCPQGRGGDDGQTMHTDDGKDISGCDGGADGAARDYGGDGRPRRERMRGKEGAPRKEQEAAGLDARCGAFECVPRAKACAAVRYDGGNAAEVAAWRGLEWLGNLPGDGAPLSLHSAQGDLEMSPGDVLVRDRGGNFRVWTADAYAEAFRTSDPADGIPPMELTGRFSSEPLPESARDDAPIVENHANIRNSEWAALHERLAKDVVDFFAGRLDGIPDDAYLVSFTFDDVLSSARCGEWVPESDSGLRVEGASRGTIASSM